MKIYFVIIGVIAAFYAVVVQAESITPIKFPASQIDTSSHQISVKVSSGLTRTNSLPSKSLRTARLRMLAKHDISDSDLRALAEHGDGLAALKYVRLLVARHGNDRAHASDIAYFGAIAVGTGRVWPLKDMVEAMHLLNPGGEPVARIRKYISVIYPHAWAGNSLALDAVIEFNGDGKLFGELSEKTRLRILEQSRKNGGGRVELQMAVNIMKQPEITAGEKKLASIYLTIAASAEDLAIKATAENLLLLLDANGT